MSGDPRKPRGTFDFGARAAFDALAAIGPARIVAAAWVASIAAFAATAGWDILVTQEEQGRRTVLTDAKAVLRRALSGTPPPRPADSAGTSDAAHDKT